MEDLEDLKDLEKENEKLEDLFDFRHWQPLAFILFNKLFRCIRTQCLA